MEGVGRRGIVRGRHGNGHTEIAFPVCADVAIKDFLSRLISFLSSIFGGGGSKGRSFRDPVL